MTRWKVLDHTADLAIEAHGDSPEKTLQALLEGLLAQITIPARVHPRHGIAIETEGIDIEESLVNVLGEILFWVNTKGWLFSRFEVAPVTHTKIQLIAYGEPRDADRHPFNLEVKAATYHELFLDRDESTGHWKLHVLFDV